MLNLQKSTPFHCRWPIKHGQLNIHGDVGGSPSAVLEDLTTLWGNVIENKLKIPVTELNSYR